MIAQTPHAEDLLEIHAAALSTARRYCPQQAEDIAQDVVLRSLRKVRIQSPKVWGQIGGRNGAIDFLRAKQREREGLRQLHAEEPIPESSDPCELLADTETLQQVKQILKQMPAELREVAIFRGQGISLRGISKLLGISKTAAATKVKQVEAIIRQHMHMS